MLSKLDDLPTLVMSLILEEICQSSPSALWSLALVNKACYHATTPLLYRNLALPISSRQKLREDCVKLEEHPFCKKFLTHARHLKISGRMPLRRNEERRPHSAEEYEPGDTEEFEAEFGGVFGTDPPEGSGEEVFQAWNPLAVVIQKCGHISDLIWVCRNQLPQCVFQVITQQNPFCRMEIRSFRLLSLRESITDPHERDLIQSPCLHSISVKTVCCDAYGKVDYNGDAIFQIVSLAPNLKHVNIVKPEFGAAPNALRNLRKEREPWKGFVPPLEIQRKGALTSLTYFGRKGMNLNDIQKWPKHTDMSKLWFLMLGEVSDPLVFDYMRQINFLSLETLDIMLNPTREIQHLLLHSLELCIEHLKPLQGLRLEGYLTSTLVDHILQRHGPTLRRLVLLCGQEGIIESPLSVIRENEIWKIESHCAVLEYLGISIPKSRIQGADPDRGDLCGICPSLPHLRELVLNIHEHTPTLDLSSEEEILRKIWALINNNKEGCSLARLMVSNSSGSGMVLQGNDVTRSNDVELSLLEYEQLDNQLIVEQFHGLPTVRFRFSDGLCLPFKLDAGIDY